MPGSAQTQSSITSAPRGARTPSRSARLAAVAGAVASAAALTGCSHWDSYMDPSVLGRWEQTPTVVPILESLAPIEENTGTVVDYSEVASEDLIPEPESYEIGAGDFVEITIYDLIVVGQPVVVNRVIDQNGYVEIPVLGRVFVSGLTEEEAKERVEALTADYVADPLVSVVIQQRRTQSFHLQGNVIAPGSYQIPSSDYRLLEALIAAGGVNEATSNYVYVIRQVALGDDAAGGRPERTGDVPPAGGGSGSDNTEEGDELIDIIDDITGGSPAVMSAGAIGQPSSGEGQDPAIDLIEGTAASQRTTQAPASGPRWVFLNGQWVQAMGGSTAPTGSAGNGDAAGDDTSGIVTQRVIRVPLKPLLAGDARYNIVVRPGDVVRLPPPEAGNVYIGGQIARPGVYTLPPVGRLTLTRSVVAAGGLGTLAIPERVDLTRMVGPDRQATIMLNLRAIQEGTHPDIFLKPDDHVNIGTNAWALPLAVVRNGFRASYGFGFLLDRNFGNDVFGAPPTRLEGR